jgi:hypothetical protein
MQDVRLDIGGWISGPSLGGKDDRQAGIECLEKLAEQLDSGDFATRIVTERRGQWPSLHVTNRRAGMLSEDIFAGPDAFWWGWAERIAPLADIPAAAVTVARVLADWP